LHRPGQARRRNRRLDDRRQPVRRHIELRRDRPADMGPVGAPADALAHHPAPLDHTHGRHMMRITTLPRRLRRLASDTRGNFALMTAGVAPMMLVLAAIGVDTGSLYLEKRRRSEEHTSELQSRENLVCRLLLEK